jgi:hypothetical protein
MSNIKSGIWYLGIASWLFGISDRSLAAISDGFVSGSDLILLFTAAFYFVSWLFLKPNH